MSDWVTGTRFERKKEEKDEQSTSNDDARSKGMGVAEFSQKCGIARIDTTTEYPGGNSSDEGSYAVRN